MDKQSIKIFCYTGSPVYVEAPHRNFMMSGGSIDTPSVEIMTFEELDYINTHSNLIKSGRVEFEENEREEIYRALKINDWKNQCVFERDIDTLLTKATMDTLQRIVKMTDIATVDRLRGHIIMHGNARDLDISLRVKDTVSARYKELMNGTVVSRIAIVRKNEAVTDGSGLDMLVAQKVAEELAKLAIPLPKTESAIEYEADFIEDEIATPTVKPKVEPKTKAVKPVESKSESPTSSAPKRGRPSKKSV